LRSRLEQLPRNRVYAALCAVLVATALLVVPTWPPHAIGGASNHLVSVAGLATVWAMVAVGTAMFVNLAGLPTLAHAGLWGVGAYASGVTITHLEIGFWPSLLFAAAVPALVALPVGLISLRTTGVAFLVVTIAFTEFIVLVIGNMSITEGTAGLAANEPPGSIGPLHFDGLVGQYYLFLAFLFATIGVYLLVTRSGFGARLRAIRDDERLARSLGINVLLHQLLLFELTAVIVGLGGALLLVQQGAVTPDLFTAFQFIPIYLAIMLGGFAVIAGPAVGAWIAQFLPLWIGSEDPNISLLIYGLILVAAMLVLPRGILGTLKAWVARDPKAPAGPPAPEAELVPRPAPSPARTAPADLSGAEILLQAEGVRRWFGANRALDGVDLAVRSGEIRGLIGPNGSGKTTLLNCVSGFLPLTGGTISYRGLQLDGRGPDRIARLGLVRTFQEPEVFESFTVRETCELIAKPARTRPGANDRLPDRPDEMLDACGLSKVADARVTELPYGQLRLLGVLAAIACRPFVLLLDEPAAGLATPDAASLRELILRARDLGVTVVVVDHDMSFLLPICDSVTVLDGGEKLAEGDPDEIARDPAVIAAYLGESFAKRNAAKMAGTVEG
jgi:ABC-type branched-subunit amino acid transport system ATPase component/ABC-type branched-subunit amino acid transport system permease subunit